MVTELVRYFHPDLGPRLGLVQGETVYDLTASTGSVSEWLRSSVNRVDETVAEMIDLAQGAANTFDASLFDNEPRPQKPHWFAPVDAQDVWASGVTYIRSRAARQEEAVDGGDVYARVYGADRPELFFKAQGRQVVGHLDRVGIRHDATWSVPEAELGVVLNPALEIVGFTVGNDMSSRDIEGENPLYLPQAKMYRRACALGRGLVLMPRDTLPELVIDLRIERSNTVVFQDSTSTQNIKRSAAELVDYLGRCLDFPDGVILLTGTGIVPPSDFTLQGGDVVHIEIAGFGSLQNTVEVV